MNPIRGHEAIEVAEREGIDHLWKYTDPVEDARWVTLDEAREIVREDPGLIELRITTGPRMVIDGDSRWWT